MTELTIRASEAGRRLDKFLKKYLREAPSSFIYKMLRKKNIRLNGHAAKGQEMLAEGDVLTLYFSDETLAHFRGSGAMPEKAGFRRKDDDQHDARIPDVVYEDRHFLIFNKPAGLLTQKSRPEDISCADLLIRYLTESGSFTADSMRAFRPAPVNRLDRNTSGLVLCGKTVPGLQYLSLLLREREAEKQYLALVFGHAQLEGEQVAYLRKDAGTNRVDISGRELKGYAQIRTAFHVLAASEEASLVEADLLTGKTHQIRAQLAYLGTPVIGDRKYGDAAGNRLLAGRDGVHRQLLHAWKFRFPAHMPDTFHDAAGKTVCADLPADFLRTMRVLHLERSL